MNEKNIVVVIDPGHGGENLGADYGPFLEKEMNLAVGKAMYDRLSQFEGITVYLTREDDEELSLKERVEYAASVKADFFFCLHFNLSEHHTLYGAETWVSSKPELYAKGYDFSKIELEMLTELGLWNRGIKTRLKKNQKEDYYGVIREATNHDIPSVIIEHCHLDHRRDEPFCKENTDQWMETYGEIDAVSVAKYFGLYNPVTGEDYRDYPAERIPIPESQVKPDQTSPEVAILTLEEINEEEETAQFCLEARDADSPLLYYAYSFDQGITTSERFPWTSDTGEITFQVPLKAGEVSQVCGVVYNLYDLETVSNVVAVELDEKELNEHAVGEEAPYQEEDPYLDYHEIPIPKVEHLENGEESPALFVGLALGSLLLCLCLGFILCSLGRRKRRKKVRSSE